MSPRVTVLVVSTAIEGSAPCPPGSTMSGPKDGLPPGDPAAPAPGTVITAANAMSASTRPSRRSDRSTRMIPPRSASAAPPLRDRWQGVLTGRGDFETLSLHGRGSAYDRELGSGEIAVAAELVQSQLDPPRQQQRAAPERDGRDRHQHFIEQARVGKLTCQVAAADDPDVPATRRFDQLPVHGLDVPADELNLRIRHDPQVAVRENPAGQLVRPLVV